jgi:hypothetical protein
LLLDGEEFEFSDGFTDLHTVVYREILAGRGFGLAEARPSINLVHELRNTAPAHGSCMHPFVRCRGQEVSLLSFNRAGSGNDAPGALDLCDVQSRSEAFRAAPGYGSLAVPRQLNPAAAL